MKKRLMVLMAVILIAAVFAGCTGTSATSTGTSTSVKESSGASSESSAPSESSTLAPVGIGLAPVKSDGAAYEFKEPTADELKTIGNKKVALLVKDSTNPFWAEVIAAAKQQCEAWGWTLVDMAPVVASNNDEQIQLLEQALLDPPQLFIIIPADSKGIAPAIEKINEANIPIINLNSRITAEGCKCETFIACENKNMAYASTSAAIKMIGETGKALIIEGTTGSQTAIDRTAGCKKAFEENPGWTILDTQTAKFYRQEALTVTQNLLQKYPEVDLIWTASGEMALGSYEAVKQAGRQEKVKIATINAYGELVAAISDGKVLLSMDDAGSTQGVTAIRVAMDYFRGQKLSSYYEIVPPVVTKDNIAPYLVKYPYTAK